MNPSLMSYEYLMRVSRAVMTVNEFQVGRAAALLVFARQTDRMVWLVGNGGSAATASHFAGDLRKMGNIRAVALPDMVPTVTAYGNDHGWENMYSLPLAVLRSPGDVLVAISCSGNSVNVLNAAKEVSKGSLIVLTGEAGHQNCLSGFPAEAMISVLDGDIRVQEDVHLAVCHAIAGCLRESG